MKHTTVKSIKVISGFNLRSMKKIRQMALTNLKTLVSPLLMRPLGSQGCQKMRQDPLNANLEIWCANMEPKLHNLWKTVRKRGFLTLVFAILTVFQRLRNLSSILAHQTSKFKFSGSCCIFWHPWDPWGRVNSGMNCFSVHTATVKWFIGLWRNQWMKHANLFRYIYLVSLSMLTWCLPKKDKEEIKLEQWITEAAFSHSAKVEGQRLKNIQLLAK